MSAAWPQFQDNRDHLDHVHDSIQSWLEASVTTPSASTLSGGDELQHQLERLSCVDSRLQTPNDEVQNPQRMSTPVLVDQNHLLPIHSLPTELLCAVFTICVELDVRQTRIHPAMTLSHTCSLWRALSLQHPAMWSVVDLSKLSLRFAELVLSRGGEFPLRVIGCDASTRREVTALIPENSHRLEELNMKITSMNDSLGIVTGTPRVVYSKLRRVWLECASDTFPDPPPYAVVSSPILGNGSPNLLHLSLYGIRAPFRSGYYKNLATLKISNAELFDSAFDEDICWILKESPNMESVEVCLDCIRRNRAAGRLLSAGSTSPGLPSIPLNHLKSLTLKVPIALAHRLLSSIASDSTELVDIDLQGHEYPDHDVSSLLELSPGLRPTRILQEIQALRVDYSRRDFHHNSMVRVHVSATRRIEDAGRIKPAFSLRWTEFPSRAPQMLSAVAHAICSRYGMSKLRLVTLSLSLYDIPSDEPCQICAALCAFAYLPHYTHLKLLANAHRIVTRAEPQNDAGGSTLPPLEAVTIEGQLHHDEAQRLWAWLHRLGEGLRTLDMRESIVLCKTVSEALACEAGMRAFGQSIPHLVWPRLRLRNTATGGYGPPQDVQFQ